MSDYVSVVVNMKTLPASIGNLLMSIISRHKREEEEGNGKKKKDTATATTTTTTTTTTLVLSKKGAEGEERKALSGTSPMLMLVAALLFSGGMSVPRDRYLTVSSEASDIVLHKAKRLGDQANGRWWSESRFEEVSPVKIEEEDDDDDDDDDDIQEEEEEKVSKIEEDEQIFLSSEDEFERSIDTVSFLEALGGKLEADPELLMWLERLRKIDLKVEQGAMTTHGGVALARIEEEESAMIRISIPRHVLVKAQRSNNKLRDVLVSSAIKFSEEKKSLQLLKEANRSIVDSVPISSECTCGVYRLIDSRGPVAIWKPEDEENSKKKKRVDEKPLREGLEAGDGAVREVAAYALDHASGGRAGVPVTMLTLMDGRRGSLQRFQDHKCCADDVGTMLFEDANVHDIGILDLRLFNLDRHGGNILVDEANRLIPIDHGLSLPPIGYLGEAEFGWMHWRQAKVPFSPETLDRIRALSPANDARLLEQIGIPKASISTNFVGTSVLKHFALKKGMNLHDIASLFCRRSTEEAGSNDRLSVLEKAVKLVKDDSNSDEQLSRQTIAAMEDILVETNAIPWDLGMSTASLWRRWAPRSLPETSSRNEHDVHTHT